MVCRITGSVVSGLMGERRMMWVKTPFRFFSRQARKLVRQFVRDEGVTTTEYALLLALVVVALIGTLSTLGAALDDKLKDIIQNISSAQ